MKTLKKLFILSFKNLKCRKWLNIKIVTALTFLILFVSLFSVVGISISNMRSTLFKQTVSSNYLQTYHQQPLDKPMPEGTQVIEYIHAGNSPRIQEIIYEQYGSGYYYVIDTQSLRLEVGAKTFISEAREPGFNNPYNVAIIACQNPFTENDYKALKTNFGLNNFIIGKMPEAADEAVISATLLGYYNLSYEDVLGKQITFCYFDHGKMWEPFTVTGIIIPEYTKLRGHVNGGAEFSPDVIVAEDSESVFETYDYIYSFPNWLTKEEVKYLTSSGGATYEGEGTLREADNLAQIQTVTTNLFTILGVSFGVGLLLIIYLLTDRFTRYFVRGGGVLLTEGIGERELNALTIVQILLLCGVAVLASFVLTTAVYSAVREVLNRHVFGWMELMPLNGMFFCIVFGVGLAMILAVTLFLFFNIFTLTRKKSIKELLNTTAD